MNVMKLQLEIVGGNKLGHIFLENSSLKKRHDHSYSRVHHQKIHLARIICSLIYEKETSHCINYLHRKNTIKSTKKILYTGFRALVALF